MRRAPRRLLLLACGAALVAATSLGCGSGAKSMDEFRSLVLARTASDVVLPSLRDADADAHALEAALDTLAAAPSAAALSAAQAAWRDARRSWNRVEAVLIGPAEDRLLASKVDTSPSDAPRIEDVIAGADPIDVALVQSLGSTRKGFHAIEYLLFDPAGDDAAVLDDLTVGPFASRRLALLSAYGEDVANVVEETRFTWEPAGEDHADAFATAGTGSAVYATRQAALDDLVNHLIAFSELIADRRLGRPLGRTSGGLPQAPGAESERSGNSREDVLGDLLGLRDVYEGSRDGAPGSGISSLMRLKFKEIHLAIRADLDAAIAAVEAVPETLLETAQTDPALVETAFDAVRRLRIRLATDLTGALGGTLTFSPFDGD